MCCEMLASDARTCFFLVLYRVEAYGNGDLCRQRSPPIDQLHYCTDSAIRYPIVESGKRASIRPGTARRGWRMPLFVGGTVAGAGMLPRADTPGGI